MAFDVANAPHSETEFRFREGPHDGSEGHPGFIWATVTATFPIADGPVPSIRIMVPIEVAEHKTLADMRQEAFEAARALLSHRDLAVAFSAERREPLQ